MAPLAFLNIGPWEIALITILALLLFGGKRLPGLAKDLGSGIKEFRKSLSSAAEEDVPSEERNHSLEDKPGKSKKKS
jgi:sec-independent protein translocase protein TatA